MPPQRGKSDLVAKLGDKLRRAAAEHRDDPVELSAFGDLPAGIAGGVAQLVDCKFTQVKEGKNNAGQWMFYAAGAVKAPVEFEGQRIEGLRTQISEPLFETPSRTRKTISDHYAFIRNEMLKLGLDPTQIAEDGSNIEECAELLKAAGPHFRFRTWKGQKQTTGQFKDREPMVNHVWNGACEFSANGEPTDAVEDATDEAVAADEGSADADTEAVEESTGAAGPGDHELDELVEQADAKDKAAQKRLTNLATESGCDAGEVESAESWQAVAEMIRINRSGEGGEEAAAEEEAVEEEQPVPAKGEVWGYKPIDPKTKKRAKKPVKVDVVAVDKKTETATVKRLDTKTVVKGVAFADLEVVE